MLSTEEGSKQTNIPYISHVCHIAAKKSLKSYEIKCQSKCFQLFKIVLFLVAPQDVTRECYWRITKKPSLLLYVLVHDELTHKTTVNAVDRFIGCKKVWKNTRTCTDSDRYFGLIKFNNWHCKNSKVMKEHGLFLQQIIRFCWKKTSVLQINRGPSVNFNEWVLILKFSSRKKPLSR